MSRERLANAYEEQAALFARLADATAQIAHELRGIEPPASAGVPGAAGSGVPLARTAAPAVPFSDDEIPLKPQVEAGLGKCPTHGTAWVIKAAGVGKNGKPYRAFWKCAQKDDDTFCNQKPQPIWAQTHPAEAAA